MKQTRSGFSLLELSIVLVIIGLLAGGVMTGQSLIRAAELRAVSNEYTKFKTAMGAFRDKYMAIPGDFKDARKFWGAANPCPGIFSSPAGGTCDGDGDGWILAAEVSANELFRFWQHLALAGMIEGSFTGVSSAGTYNTETTVIGSNLPASKLTNSGWSMTYIAPQTVASTLYFEGNYGNVFYFGSTVAGYLPSAAIFKPEEAWNIDTKLDDGRPATGIVRTFERDGSSSGTGCIDLSPSSSASVASASYSVANTGIACGLVLDSGY